MRRRVFFIVVLMGIVSVTATHLDAVKEFAQPSWAYVWKLPLSYFVGCLLFWLVYFGIFYDDREDRSGDGALAFVFIPLFPILGGYYLIKDTISDVKAHWKKDDP